MLNSKRFVKRISKIPTLNRILGVTGILSLNGGAENARPDIEGLTVTDIIAAVEIQDLTMTDWK